MGKHTEGPWIEYLGHQVSGSLGDCVMFATDRGELISSTDANRDLVRAAPDFLEALESLVRAVDSKMPDAYMSSLSRDVHHVIAQAKGES